MKRYREEVVIEEYLLATLLHRAGTETRLKFRNHEWRRSNRQGRDYPDEDTEGRKLFPRPIPVSDPSNAIFKLFEFVNDYNKRLDAGWSDTITTVIVGRNKRAILDMDHEVFKEEEI